MGYKGRLTRRDLRKLRENHAAPSVDVVAAERAALDRKLTEMHENMSVDVDLRLRFPADLDQQLADAVVWRDKFKAHLEDLLADPFSDDDDVTATTKALRLQQLNVQVLSMSVADRDRCSIVLAAERIARDAAPDDG